MPWWVLLWGAVGGALVELLELSPKVKRGGEWPWVQLGTRAHPYLIMMVLRILAGGVLAVAISYSGQIQTPVAALEVGISAPLIVERLRGYRETDRGAAEPDDGAPAAPANGDKGPPTTSAPAEPEASPPDGAGGSSSGETGGGT